MVSYTEAPGYLSCLLRGRVSITGSDAHAVQRIRMVGVDISLESDSGYASQDNGTVTNVLMAWAAFRFRRPFANQLGYHRHRL